MIMMETAQTETTEKQTGDSVPGQNEAIIETIGIDTGDVFREQTEGVGDSTSLNTGTTDTMIIDTDDDIREQTEGVGGSTSLNAVNLGDPGDNAGLTNEKSSLDEMNSETEDPDGVFTDGMKRESTDSQETFPDTYFFIGSYKNMQSTAGLSPPCKKCREAIKQVDTLGMQGELSTGEGRHLCYQCGTVLAWVGEFIYEKIQSGNKHNLCMQCGHTFDSFSDLENHERIHDAEEHAERRYRCDHCIKAFANARGLKVHKRVHTGEKPYQCFHCGRTFATIVITRIHERTHTDERPYKCGRPNCGKACKSGSALASHHLSVHSNKRPFKCNECVKAFKLASDLRKHKYVHVNERPHRCKYCMRAFKRFNTLRVHEACVHRDERPFHCENCNETFGRNAGLLRHRLDMHIGKRNHRCKDCKEVFRFSRDLRAHRATVHPIGKPYQCNHCPRAFPFPSDLMTHHKRMHSDDRLDFSINCKYCARKFTSCSDLKSHARRHTCYKTSSKCEQGEETSETSRNLRLPEKLHSAEEAGEELLDECTK